MQERRTEDSSDHWTLSRSSFLPLAGLAAVVWLIRYVGRYGVHLSRAPHWVQFFDQSRYFMSAQAFAHGDLLASSHWYPLAYPLLAAPFVWVLPNDPFILPDLALFVVTFLAFAQVVRRLNVNSAVATILFLLGTMAIGKVAKLWLDPWTTSFSTALIWSMIAHTLALTDLPPEGSPRRRSTLLLGVLAGTLPLVRPVDGLIAIVDVLFAVALLWQQDRLRVTQFGWMLLGAVIVCLPYGALHLAIYGLRASDYARAAAAQGFAFTDLPWKAYVVLVTAAPWFPRSPSLVEVMPWFVPGLAGLGIAYRDGDRRARVALTLVAVLAVPYSAIFLAYTDLQPPGLWRFSNAHYFKWLTPLLTIGVWLWLRAASSRRGALRAGVALLIVLVPTMIRPMPITVSDAVPARMLLFRGATNRDWASAYFSPATVTDERGRMANVGQFHQVPDDYGERALAVSRLFVGPTIRNDPGEAPPLDRDQKAYARYAVRISIGAPCWLKILSTCHVPPASAQVIP